MSEASPLDTKAARAIAVLMDRRASWAVITYGDLSVRIGHPQYALSDVLNRIAAWCETKKKHSLALLVIEESGRPSTGMFVPLPTKTHLITENNYEAERVKLWRESWGDMLPPRAEEVTAAYAEIFKL